MRFSVMTFAQRLRAFVLAGLATGLFYAIVALAVGGLALATRSPARIPVPLLLVYPIAGVTGGALVAVTFPLVRWVGGAFIVGALAVFPLYLGASLAIAPDSWFGHAEISAALALFVGGVAGAREWMKEHRRPHQLAHVWVFAGVCSVVAWIIGGRWAGQWPAYGAILLFLIPVAIALFVTMDRRRHTSIEDDRAA